MIILTILYCLLGVIAVVVSLFFTDDHPDLFPAGSLPAVRFTVGVLWPLFLAGLLFAGVAIVLASVVRGFVVLWRAWRPKSSVTVPRATARDRMAP